MYSRIIRLRPLVYNEFYCSSTLGIRTLRNRRYVSEDDDDVQPEKPIEDKNFPQSFRDLQRMSYQTTNPYTAPAPSLKANSTIYPEKALRYQKKEKSLEPKLPEVKKKIYKPLRQFATVQDLVESGHEITDDSKAIFVPSALEDCGIESADERPKLIFPISENNQHLKIQNLVTALHYMPYQKQLKMKYFKNYKFLVHFQKFLRKKKANGALTYGKLPCLLTQVRPSPVTEEYRNRDTFSIRAGLNGNPKTVGFFIGNYKETEKPVCVPPTEIRIIKKEHKEVAKVFEEYLQQSPLDPCLSYSEEGGGNWCNLVVRSNQNGDLMAMPVLFKGGLTPEQLEEEKQRLKDFFSQGPGSHLGLKSLYFQAKTVINSSFKECPAELLLGDTNLTETIAGLSVVIRPQTYLPVNIPAAENFYDSLQETALVTSSTTVIDIGCQSGILSLFLAKKAEKVIGIDNDPGMIQEAIANASLNNVKNTKFLHGDYHDLIPHVLDDTYSDDIVVVVHPTACGMPKKTMSLLRKKKDITRIIYATSNPESLIQPNLSELCCPPLKGDYLTGQPFAPAHAVQVDILPHTYNCELILHLERVKSRSATAHALYKRPQ